MTDKLYMLAVDVSDDRLDADRLRAIIKNPKLIRHWWNHLPSLFILQTAASADELASVVQPALGAVSFMVMEVNPENSEGLLPESAWNWVRRRITEIKTTVAAE